MIPPLLEDFSHFKKCDGLQLFKEIFRDLRLECDDGLNLRQQCDDDGLNLRRVIIKLHNVTNGVLKDKENDFSAKFQMRT